MRRPTGALPLGVLPLLIPLLMRSALARAAARRRLAPPAQRQAGPIVKVGSGTT